MRGQSGGARHARGNVWSVNFAPILQTFLSVFAQKSQKYSFFPKAIHTNSKLSILKSWAGSFRKSHKNPEFLTLFLWIWGSISKYFDLAWVIFTHLVLLELKIRHTRKMRKWQKNRLYDVKMTSKHNLLETVFFSKSRSKSIQRDRLGWILPSCDFPIP